MPITNTVPTNVVSARLKRAFDAEVVWQGIGTDLSDELSDSGKSIDLGEVTTDISVGDYTKGADITVQSLDDGKDTLDLDKQKYWAIAVDDIDQVQARPNVLDEGTRKAAVKLAAQVDADAKAEWIASIPSGQSIVASNKVNTKALRTADAGKALMADLNEIVFQMDSASYPATGRYLIMSPQMATAIRRHILENNPGDGTLANSAFANGANRGELLGFNARVDVNAGYTGAQDSPLCYVLHEEAMYYAEQIRKVEPVRRELQFADLVKGLYVYGYAKFDDYIFELKNGA